MNRPNSELVVCAWVNSIPGLTRSPNFCATSLPSDNATWGASGFVTAMAIGGTRDIDIQVGRPVMHLGVWACQPGGSKPLWGKAFNLAEALINASFDEANMRRLLTLSANGKGYGSARVLECYPLGEPTRMPDDPSAYAHVVMDFQFHWVVVS